jgi:hypothetical protein
MSIQRHAFILTTSAGGGVTVNAERPILGRVIAVEVEIGTLAANVDFVITCEDVASQAILTLTNHAAANALYQLAVAQTKADGTASGTFGPPFVSGKPRIVVTDGGATKTGKVILYVEQ